MRLGGLIKRSHMVPMDPKGFDFCAKKLGKIQIFEFLGTKMPISRALLGPNGANFDTRTVGVSENFRSLAQDVLRYFGIMIISKNGP